MENALSKKFTFSKLLLFALPNVVMMVFTSIYSIVDGIFVLSFSGDDALASLNLFLPFFYIMLSIGIMLGAGSSALIGLKLGQKKDDEARRIFSFMAILALGLGVIFVLIGVFFIDGLVELLGAKGDLFYDCKIYGFTLLMFAPALFFQNVFQSLFVTAGKSAWGLACSVVGGVINMVLDYVFMGVLCTGIVGAAIATGLGQFVIFPVAVIYFSVNRKGSLYFVKPFCSFKNLLKILGNGSSEMATNLAGAVTTYLFNAVCLSMYGKAGVSAIAILMYFQFLFGAVFMGYTMGVAPIFSYKYGEENYAEIKSCYKYSMIFIAVSSAVMVLLCATCGVPIIGAFKPDKEVYSIAVYGLWFYLYTFVFMGFNVFASGMFTAFNNGRISALVALMRTFVFLAPLIVLMPMIAGKAGIFLSTPISELLAAILAGIMMILYKEKYNLFGKREVKPIE